MELILGVLSVVAVSWAMAKRQVDDAVATVNAERPDKEPLPVNSWLDSGCLVLLLIVFVVVAVSVLSTFVPLPTP